MPKNYEEMLAGLRKLFTEVCTCEHIEGTLDPLKKDCNFCLTEFFKETWVAALREGQRIGPETRDFVVAWLEDLERKDRNGSAYYYNLLKHLPDPKRDGYGDFVLPNKKYYVQDARSYVGNCMSWWAPERNGYVCELDKAGIYEGWQVIKMRETDVPWPVKRVEAAILKHVTKDQLLQDTKKDVAEVVIMPGVGVQPNPVARQLVADAAKATERFSDDELEESARKERAKEPVHHEFQPEDGRPDPPCFICGYKEAEHPPLAKDYVDKYKKTSTKKEDDEFLVEGDWKHIADAPSVDDILVALEGCEDRLLIAKVKGFLQSSEIATSVYDAHLGGNPIASVLSTRSQIMHVAAALIREQAMKEIQGAKEKKSKPDEGGSPEGKAEGSSGGSSDR